MNTRIESYTSLPIYKYQIDIGKCLTLENRLIIIGETGCGKTTQVPKIIFNNLANKNDLAICVTQPRRVAAVSVALRVSHEMNSKIGDLVGYSVRFDERTSKNTKIKYVTDGMLLREAIIDKELSKYSVIIIDEVHERSINTDTLLALVLRIQKYRSDLKLVLMSATIDTKILTNYLKTENVIRVEGRSFPIQIYHSLQSEKNIVDAACITILQIHLFENDEEYKNGDILVFLPGQEDIEDLYELLKIKNELLKNDISIINKKLFDVYQLFSNMPNLEQMKVFKTIDSSKYRKVILATNIAETSVTVKNVKYVIDSGYFKVRVFDAQNNLDLLKLTRIYKSSAIQRAGRAGRESSGKCFRLYTEEEHDSFQESATPEIIRSNLRNLIILIKSIGIEKLNDLEYLDKPPKETHDKCIEELKALNALDFDENLTKLGKQISILPVEPSLGKILINAFTNDDFNLVQNDILTLVSLLQSDNVFYSPSVSREKAESIRSKFTHTTSDHLTLLNVYLQWKEYLKDNGGKGEKWASENFINEKSLIKADEIKKQLKRYLEGIMDSYMMIENEIDNILIEKKTNLHEEKNKLREMKEELIFKVLLSGYIFNVAKYESDNVFKTKQGRLCRVHPNSVVCKNFKLAKTAGYLIYSEVIYTSKEYLKCCSIVDRTLVETNVGIKKINNNK